MTGETHGSELPRLSELGVNNNERCFLQLLRLQCTSYEQDHMRGMDAALSFAEDQFGPDTGPLIAVRMAALVRAIRAERCAGFSYLSPVCASCRERITLAEWQLLSLMRAARLAGQDAAEICARELAERSNTPKLVEAAKRFAEAAALVPAESATSRAARHLH